MIKGDIRKIIIITKEKGIIEFTDDESWHNFRLSSVTLHSTFEPAYQEYYINSNYAKFIWYHNGLHHRPYKPNVYKIDMNQNHKYNHDLDFNKKDFNNFKSFDKKSNKIYWGQYHLNGKKYNIYDENSFNEFMNLSNKFSRETKLEEIFL